MTSVFAPIKHNPLIYNMRIPRAKPDNKQENTLPRKATTCSDHLLRYRLKNMTDTF